jgi:tyrosine-protein kinase Etk/Wzc
MSNPNQQVDEIDLKEVVSIIYKYKHTMMFFATIAFFLSIVFAYFAQNVYSTSATVEIVSDQRSRAGSTDMLTMAFGISNNNIDNELEILHSRFIATKALKSLSIGTRYYTTHNYKERELYKNSPFVVKVDYLDNQLLGKKISILPINATSFRLELEPKLLEQLKIKAKLVKTTDQTPTYSQVHTYGKSITTPWAKFSVEKLFELNMEPYAFSYMPNEYMDGFISGKLSASAISEFGTVISIEFKDNVAKRAKEIVNAIADAYLLQEIERNTDEADKTLSFIDFQLETINKSLQASASTLEIYKSENQLIDLSAKATITADELSRLESELYAQNIELEVLENLNTHLAEHSDISSLSLESTLSNNKAINQLFSQLQIRETKKKSLLIEFTSLHPDVLKLSEEINNLTQTIKNTVNNKLKVAKNKKRLVLHNINEHKKTLEALPGQEKELASLTRSYMVNENIYSYLLEKRAETAILRASTVSKTRIIDRAITPSTPIKPKRALMVIIGTILGFILGISLAFLRNRMNDKIERVEELEKLSEIPMYGAIPIVNNKDKQPFYEALRVLRTNLQFTPKESGKRAKLIAITSSISGEGKTLVSVELSKILAQGEQKVLVVDLDLRKSKLQGHFKVSNKHGMSTFLAGKSTKEEIIQSVEGLNLDIITAGAIPPNPSELLISSAFSNLIEEISNNYDYILFDTAPIGLVTDAMTPLMLADIALFTFKANYSSRELVKSVNRIAGEKEFKHVGMIFNGVKLGKKYGYGYGYGYGDK